MSLLGHDKRMVKSWKPAPEVISSGAGFHDFTIQVSLEATAKDGQ